MAPGSADQQIAVRAVDLPHQIGAPRLAAAKMDRSDRPTLQAAADHALIGRGGGQALGRSGDGDLRSAGRQRRSQLLELAQTVTQRVQEMPAGDRQQIRPVGPVQQIGGGRLDRLAVGQARGDHAGRQDRAHIALGDQVTYPVDDRRRASLQTDCGTHLLTAGQRGHLPRLVQPVAQRPFAKHGLARFERGHHQLMVVGHLDRHDHQINVRMSDQLLMVVKGQRRLEFFGRRVCGLATAGAHRLKGILGQRRQSRNMRPQRPAAVRVGADDSHPYCVSHSRAFL